MKFHQFHPTLFTTIATAVALCCHSANPALAQDQAAVPEWYDPAKIDAWARNFVALLNASKIEEASRLIDFDGLYEIGIVSLVGDKREDPEVLAYLKEFFPVFKSILTPKGSETYQYNFLKSGADGGIVYVLLRALPNGQPKAPDLNYLQVGIAPDPNDNGYAVEDVFLVRADKSLSSVAQTMFVAMMPDSVFQKVENWSDDHAALHAQRESITAVLEQCQAGDATCIDSFLTLDPPRTEDLVLLEACSKTVFENSDDPAQIKKVMKAWQAGRPEGFCNLIWNACGMRRLGGQGWEEANKIFDVMQRYEMFQGDAYLDVLSADHSMRLDNVDDAETHARSAVEKEPNLFIARHVLHLILAKKNDFASIAQSLSELARLDSAFTLKYLQDTAPLAAFRESDAGKAVLASLQTAQ